MKHWKLAVGIVVGALASTLAIFAALPFVAQAQTAATATPQPGAPLATPGAPNQPKRGERFPDHIGAGGLISATVSVTGLTEQEVVTELGVGKSLAQIAQEKGKTAADVIAAARTQLQDRLKQAATAGKISKTQADAELAQFDQTAPQIVNDTTLGQRHSGGPGFGPRPGPGFGRGFGFGPGPKLDAGGLISATVSVTGLTEQQVVKELGAGKSLAQIAQEKGKTADDVIAAARTQLQDRLRQAVTAGKISKTQADAELARFDQTAPQIVNDTTLGQRHSGGPGFGPRPGPGFGRGFGFGPGAKVGAGGLISATVSVTGLTEQEVVTELSAGKSLAQIAQEKGNTAEDVIAAARTQLQDRLKQAVTAGKISQTQADAELAEFDQTAPQIVNDTTLGQRHGGGFRPLPTNPNPSNTNSNSGDA